MLKSRIGSWTEIGRNTTIVESTIGDYTYDDGEVSIFYSEIGQYCSIANRVRINPGQPPPGPRDPAPPDLPEGQVRPRCA